MAMAGNIMGPPAIPGFSLRVKLFAPGAADETARPTRCFRVVTSPDVTIREFCSEASRIHEINYGSPLSIRKCMDDELFDVTQNDIVGPLFPNMSTIRIVQAPAKPNIRDSLPPTSALRFNAPSVLSQKRDRGQGNGNDRDFWNPQKRQRMSMVDPDHPLPSRETDARNGRIFQDIDERIGSQIIPDSQQSTDLVPIREDKEEDEDNFEVVREDSPTISETPSPSLSPDLPKASHQSHMLTNVISKATTGALQYPSGQAQRALISPFEEALPRTEVILPNGTGGRSASYHIQRASDRGISVSTKATSPLLGEPQLPDSNESSATSKRKLSDPRRYSANGNTPRGTRPLNQSDIYDDFGTDAEEAPVTARTPGTLKLKASPRAGLPGLELAAKINTPPSSSRRPLAPLGSTSAPGELPLTPRSRQREREEQLHQEKLKEEANEARAAAAKAAEERRREAERQAVEAKAERLRKEKEEERKAEEKRREATRKAKEEAEAQKARDEDERKRLRKEAEDKANAAAKAVKTVEHSTPKGTPTASPRTTPSAIVRPPRSSTPHIPLGRKSALRRSVSSAIAPSSSPEASSVDVSLEAQMPLPPKTPRRVSFNVNDTVTPSRAQIKKQTSVSSDNSRESATKPSSSQTPIPLPKTFKRPAPKTQPSKPSPMNQSPMVQAQSKLSSSRAPTPKPIPAAIARNFSGAKAAPKLNITPESTGRAREKSKSPIKPVTAEAAEETSEDEAEDKDDTLKPDTKNANSLVEAVPTAMSEDDSESEDDEPVKPSPKKAVKPASAQVSEDSSDSEDDVPANLNPRRNTKSPVKPTSAQVPKNSSKSEDDVPTAPKKSKSPSLSRSDLKKQPADDVNEDVEMASNHPSSRESRSPVIFHSNAPSGDERRASARRNGPVSPSGSSDSESSKEDGSEEDSEEEPGTAAKPDATKSEVSDASDKEDSDEDEDEDGGFPTVRQHSSPELPRHNHRVRVSSEAGIQRKLSSDDESNIQNEVDQQLTSDMFEGPGAFSIPIPPITPRGRPPLKFGASLTSLNSQHKLANKTQTLTKLPKPQLSSQFLKHVSASESEEESSDDSDTDEEQEPSLPSEIPATSQVLGRVNGNANAAAKKPTKADDSDSGSTGDDSENEMQRIRNSLMSQVYGLQSQVSQSQSQTSVNGASKGKGKESEQKSSQPSGGNEKGKSRSAGKEFGKKGGDRITNGFEFKAYGSIN